MENVSSEELSKQYIKDALPLSLVLTIVSLASFCILGFTPLLQMATVPVMLIMGLGGGVVFLFSFVKVITVLITAGMIRKGEGSIERTTITGYKIHWNSRRTYLYALLDNNRFCMTWSSPHYRKGTEVYYIDMHSSLMENSVMVRVIN